jgi:hypothetical protein
MESKADKKMDKNDKKQTSLKVDKFSHNSQKSRSALAGMVLKVEVRFRSCTAYARKSDQRAV